jgi:UDP-glucose 4-epimerase
MKTVLITGVAGFLGRHIASHFAQEGYRIVGVDLPAPETVHLPPGSSYTQLALPSPDFGTVLRESAPDVCIHCAGRASVPLSMKEPAVDFQDNTVLTFHLLEALRQYASRCRFVLLSSAAVYGNPKALPVSENQHIAPLSPYGFHKRQAELLCQEFARIYGVPTFAVRIFSAYGPGLRRQVVWDVCEQLLTRGRLSLKGTGRESRDFIHATDIARALLLLVAEAPAEGETYNVATGRETAIAELAALCGAALGCEIPAEFDGSVRAGDPLNWRADIGKLSAFGFAPTVSLEDGVAEVAAWAREQLFSK